MCKGDIEVAEILYLICRDYRGDYLVSKGVTREGEVGELSALRGGKEVLDWLCGRDVAVAQRQNP